ncbi:hypothetical protein [Runella slithyformis]|uniref:Uncharacterized protein n=1 Tax=Runella slithyformis (strain ATCC 29530 / DSM 19594 / LMG 11500 / NCIMB 11436 / LSU 4) TaxID=761193 RepID=A0A7U3ZKY7_RUNSL|nr:hypothetical protein [Runella slithyformis]AEI49125.1 hypothetical protein Runsl_2728 [Runella slithyformis DSM 19594]
MKDLPTLPEWAGDRKTVETPCTHFDTEVLKDQRPGNPVEHSRLSVFLEPLSLKLTKATL